MQSYEAIFITAYLIWTSLIYFRVSKYFQEKLLLRIITTERPFHNDATGRE